jgi:hypothetical protein
VVAPTGIIAWWDGDLISGATALDRVSTHHGTMLNAVQLTTGRVGNAFEFNGLNVIEVPYSTALVPSALTFEVWVRPVGPQLLWARIAGILIDGYPASLWLFGIGSHGGVYFGAFRNFSQAYIDGINPLPGSTWTHIAGTWDGVLMRAYVNGVIQPDVAAVTGPLSGTPVPLRIGRGETTAFGYRGGVDELSLYQRALTGAEIAAIAAAGPFGKCK